MAKALKNTTKTLSKNLFPVVGVGASAGGLDAFKKLIKAIPENSGMAFIFVQHLHPGHSSALPEILQRETGIPVLEVRDNIEVKPNHIYIIPVNKVLVANDGILQLIQRLEGQRNMPIDIFFESLADVHQNHAIGIVLSGTGADGTAGLKKIKDHGGITFAQELSSAAFDDMPQSAIKNEVVDFVLTPEEMPQQLLKLEETLNRLNNSSPNGAPVLPLVAGLFVIVEALNKTGLAHALTAVMNESALHSVTNTVWGSGFIIAIASNLMNNLPAGLIAGNVVQAAHVPGIVKSAVLIGVDLGPNLSITGSLATILWLVALRREGQTVTAWNFLKLGAVIMTIASIFTIASLFWL